MREARGLNPAAFMKLRFLPLALFLAAASPLALHAASDVPVFNATLTSGGETRFVLIGPDGKTSSWLKIGNSFQGWSIKAFDAKTDTLDLEREGKVEHVKLVDDAAIKEDKTATPTAATPASLADAENVLKSMNIDSMLERTIAQVRKQQLALIDRSMAALNRPGVDPDALAGVKTKMIDQLMAALDPQLMKGDITKAYSQVFTKDELGAMASFYATPLGQMIVEKQPAVQEQMNATMGPRIMAAVTSIQQTARDFVISQTAAVKAAAQQGTAPAPTPAPATAPKP